MLCWQLVDEELKSRNFYDNESENNKLSLVKFYQFRHFHEFEVAKIYFGVKKDERVLGHYFIIIKDGEKYVVSDCFENRERIDRNMNFDELSTFLRKVIIGIYYTRFSSNLDEMFGVEDHFINHSGPYKQYIKLF